MTKEKLASLPKDALLSLAQKEGLHNCNELDTETLIDNILEALEEDRQERYVNNSVAINIEEKKYVVTSEDNELFIEDSGEFTLPEYYDETEIMLLIRDPYWAFAFWGIKRTQLAEIRQLNYFKGLFLRVYRYPGTPGKNEKAQELFTIPVKLSDRKWYISLPVQKAGYNIELCYYIDEKPFVIARSNIVYSPRESVSPHEDGDCSLTDKMLSDVSRVLYFGSSFGEPLRENVIPQRIMNVSEL